jgi:hypothetical protein
MGKSCVRFTALDHADLPLISEAVGSLGVEEFLALARSSR